jgi:hypothetical protein
MTQVTTYRIVYVTYSNKSGRPKRTYAWIIDPDSLAAPRLTSIQGLALSASKTQIHNLPKACVRLRLLEDINYLPVPPESHSLAMLFKEFKRYGYKL